MVHSARTIETGLRSTKPENLFGDSAFRPWCPVSFGNSSASLRMCGLKREFLMNTHFVRVEVVMNKTTL